MSEKSDVVATPAVGQEENNELGTVINLDDREV